MKKVFPSDTTFKKLTGVVAHSRKTPFKKIGEIVSCKIYSYFLYNLSVHISLSPCKFLFLGYIKTLKKVNLRVFNANLFFCASYNHNNIKKNLPFLTFYLKLFLLNVYIDSLHGHCSPFFLQANSRSIN